MDRRQLQWQFLPDPRKLKNQLISAIVTPDASVRASTWPPT
jgi:hypothetical protein